MSVTNIYPNFVLCIIKKYFISYFFYIYHFFFIKVQKKKLLKSKDRTLGGRLKPNYKKGRKSKKKGRPD